MVARKLTTAVFAMLMLTAGVASGAAATAAPVSTADQQAETGTTLQETNNSSVNVTPGRQLSTVLTVTSDDVQSQVEETEFEIEYENASDDERAAALADRADRLRERAEEIRDAYRTATEAYEAGELTKSEYAQQVATLNSQAGNLFGSYQSLSARTKSLSALELRAAGFNASTLDESMNELDGVSGTGATALLRQFTGQGDGEVEITSENGLSIEVESEDGGESRELERPGDDSANLTVTQSTALDTARGTLTDVNSSWRLVNSRIDRDDGNYEFRFHVNTDTTVGTASVTVDGSSGAVVELEEETRLKGTARATEVRESNPGAGPPEDAGERGDDDDESEDGEERELALVVADGEIAPNGTITVRALADGEPVTGEAVRLNGEQVGTTDADGAVTVTLPAAGEVELTAGEGELEFELGEEDERDEVYRNLLADATLDGDTVTMTVRYDGSGVSDASVYANGELVGTTDADGTVSFAIANDTESLDVELVKGEFETEFEYERADGTLSQTEGPHESEDAEDGEKEEMEDDEETEVEDDEEEEMEDHEEEDMEDDEEEEMEDDEDDEQTTETETPETAEQ